MKVQFTRWCIDPNGRTPVSVEPSRVDCIVHFSHAFKHGATDEQFPAATTIIMQGKQEYTVQGSVDEVTKALNDA